MNQHSSQGFNSARHRNKAQVGPIRRISLDKNNEAGISKLRSPPVDEAKVFGVQGFTWMFQKGVQMFCFYFITKESVGGHKPRKNC